MIDPETNGEAQAFACTEDQASWNRAEGELKELNVEVEELKNELKKLKQQLLAIQIFMIKESEELPV